MAVPLLALLFVTGLNDPRIPLVELQRDGKLQEALAATEKLVEDNPDQARRLGVLYLEGDLLDRLGRRKEANDAFARVIADMPRLAPHAKLRIARDQELLGHPEVAAGLAATLLDSRPPHTLVHTTTELLARTLENGGDCRLLTTLSTAGFATRDRRLLELARARCALRDGKQDVAAMILVRLLGEKQSDLPALLAAQTLDQVDAGISVSPELLGGTFFQHRQFDRSVQLLEPVNQPLARIRSNRDFESRWRWIRAHYWLGDFELAARSYGLLAELSVSPHHVAQALFHRGRSLELVGDWQAAAVSYRNAYSAQPAGSFSAASLLAAMRLEWLAGQESSALELYERLRARPQSRYELSRAALFLAASDLAQGRTGRADRWLEAAAGASTSAELEVLYWRGRLAEEQGNAAVAIRDYLEALERDFYHPISQLALERIRTEPLKTRADHLAAALSVGGEPFSVWVLLGPTHPRSVEARRVLELRLSRANRGEPAVPPSTVAVEDWPLWEQTPTIADDYLLALGLWSEAESIVTRHFPIEQPALAATAAVELNRAGEIKSSLRITEILARRIPSWIPDPMLPAYFRELMYPFAYRYLIERASERHGVSPHLLAAIVREESRFDPTAASSAAARGLAQFVYPTALELAKKNGLGGIAVRDLERPEVSIELGAAYLGSLSKLFSGRLFAMVAAYNAGEPQAQLWLRYCFTNDPAEFLTKVSFRETRTYLEKVLSSYGHYRTLYGGTPSPDRP